MVVKVLILVQDRIFTDALATWLDAESGMRVVAALHNRVPSPSVLAASPADVVLLDAELPEDPALRVCQECYARDGGPKVVMLSQSSEPRRIVRAMRSGAVGWVRKDESLERLRDVIHAVANGETCLPPGRTGEVLRLLLRSADPDEGDSGCAIAALTPREREVLMCLAEGTGRRDMAAHLRMSPNTVRTHLQNLMGKLGVHSALEAVALTRSQVGDQPLASRWLASRGQHRRGQSQR
jgi:DNA-binding NarL/FixJ family response regulator